MWLTDLADTLRAAGLTVVEEPGWRTRGHGEMTSVQTILCHHTAGPTGGDAPSLAVVRDGRSGLAGPLAQLVLARSGAVHVVAAGLCWHAGVTLERLQGNAYAIGIEAEATGTGAWPDTQMHAYVDLCAALCRRYELGPDRVLGHKEVCDPPGRKIDPNLDMHAFRAWVSDEMGAADVAFTQEQEALIVEAAQSVLFGIEGKRAAGPLALKVDGIAHQAAAPVLLDYAALAKALLAEAAQQSGTAQR